MSGQTVDKQALNNTYAEVEILRGKLNSLFFKMEEANEDGSDPKLFKRYMLAHNVIGEAADDLLAALDYLRH